MKRLENFYTYWSSVPNIENPDYIEGVKQEVLPYSKSLMNIDFNNKYVSWRWISWNEDHRIHALMDFCVDTYIDNIVVHIRRPKNKGKVDYQRYLISYRTTEDSKYRVCYRHLRMEEPAEFENQEYFTLTFPIKQNVRCLNIQLQRNEWVQASAPQIDVYGEEKEAIYAPFTAEEFMAECENEPVIVDEYGQCSYLDWPGKITCDADLVRDAERDFEKLKDVSWNNDKYDRYGGIKSDVNYGATGFFRVQKVDGVWWFVTPEGNLYFMKGVDGITYEEMAHYTPLYITNTARIRTCFDKLPDKNKYPEAYAVHESDDKSVPVVAFQRSNICRKYGDNYRNKWAEVTHKRLIDWNFNASGKWKLEPELKKVLPRVEILCASGELIRTKSGWDPWDPDFADKIDRSFEEQLAKYKDDPMIIGFHFNNEDGWEMDDLKRILRTVNNEFPAKAAFVDFIKKRYNGDLRVVNIVLGTEAKEFEELVTTEINMDIIPRLDAATFVKESSIRFHSILLEKFRKHDPNHLFFGCTPVLGWRSSYEWDSVYAEYVDVLAFDWYFSQSADWMRPYLHLDKPIINVELGWTACDRGHSPFFNGMTCESQKERAARYTRYIKNQAKVPQFVGFGYFIYTDEVITGRSNGDGNWGECHAFGIVNEQDQPYEEFVSVIKEVNAQLEDLHRYGAEQE